MLHSDWNAATTVLLRGLRWQIASSASNESNAISYSYDGQKDYIHKSTQKGRHSCQTHQGWAFLFNQMDSSLYQEYDNFQK